MFEGLSQAGVNVIEKKCGWLNSITITPELFVLVEISDSDLHKALAAGFVVATEHMKSYSPIECSTYGL